MIPLIMKSALVGILKRIGTGILKDTPVLGQLAENIKSEDGGKDKLDRWKLLGSLIIPVIILIYFLQDKISIEVLEQLMGIFG